MSVYYKVETSQGVLYAQHVQSDPADINNRTRGDGLEINLSVPQSDLTISTDTTIGASEFVVTQNLTVESGNELIINGTLIVHGTVNTEENATIDTQDGTLNILSIGDPQNALLDYDRHAGSYTLSNTLNNTQRYKERLPNSPNVSTLVVGLEPATELQNDEIAGKWGLISNVTDSRTRALTNPLVTLEIDILGDFSGV